MRGRAKIPWFPHLSRIPSSGQLPSDQVLDARPAFDSVAVGPELPAHCGFSCCPAWYVRFDAFALNRVTEDGITLSGAG